MNPRVSRSSALASKATGFPIAKIAARLAVGYALEEIDNDITRRTPASFEPTIDYVVVKWPRFAFEKFPGADGGLHTSMQSVGEAMAIGRTFKQAFVKAMRSRELDVEPPTSTPASCSDGSRPRRTTATSCSSRRCGAACPSASCARGPASTRGSWPRSPRSRAARTPRRGSSARSSRWTPAPPSSRPRRPTTTRAGSAAAAHEVRRGETGPRVVILGAGPEPHRPGHRVRLLLRARGDDRARVGPRRGDDQLQPGDGLDRLRHLRPPLLRAARRSRTCSACSSSSGPRG